jgi:hypothetical protein
MTEKENTQHQFYLKNQKEISKEKKRKARLRLQY